MNMNKYECLNQKKKYCGESPFSGKKRVAAYCRVSTEREEQAQSFESQCDFFQCYIEEKKESTVSLMPNGLVVTLQTEEIFDLLAYLIAGGDANHPAFTKK